MKKISITTTGAAPLTFKTGSNWVDSNVLGNPRKAKTRIQTDEPYLSQAKKLGVMEWAYPAVGQIARYYHPPTPSVGHGYNGRPEDFVGDPDNTFYDYGGGILSTVFPTDFMTDTAKFVKAVGGTINLVANIGKGTYDELTTSIRLFLSYGVTVSKVTFGAECPTWMEPDVYKAVASEWIASLKKEFPAIIAVSCAGLIYRTNPATVNFNKVVPQVGAKLFNQYYQLGDVTNFTSNMDDNYLQLAVYFDVVFQDNMDKCRDTFGDMIIMGGEENVEDNRVGSDGQILPKYVDNTLLGNWAIARLMMKFISNQDRIDSVFWMGLKNCIQPDNTLSENAECMAITNSIVRAGRTVNKVTLTDLIGIDGISIQDGKTQYLLLSNSNNTEVVVDKIEVNGKKVTVALTTNARYGSSWSDTPKVKFAAGVTSPMTIPACSVGVYSFDN